MDKKTYRSFIHKYWVDIFTIIAIAFMVEINTLILNFPLLKIYKRYFILNVCLWLLIFKFFQAISNNWWIAMRLSNLLCK